MVEKGENMESKLLWESISIEKGKLVELFKPEEQYNKNDNSWNGRFFLFAE